MDIYEEKHFERRLLVNIENNWLGDSIIKHKGLWNFVIVLFLPRWLDFVLFLKE